MQINNEELEIKAKWRLKDALTLVWQSGPGWTIASFALLLIQSVLPLLALYLMKLVVDAVVAGLAAPDKSIAFRQVLLLIGVMLVVALINVISRSVAEWVSEAQAVAVTDHVHDILHAKSIAVDLAYYENSQYYDTMYRAQREAPHRPTKIVNSLIEVGQSAISLLAILALLISFHWGFAAILFVAAVPGIIVRLKYANKMYRWQHRRTSAERRAWYFNQVLTGDTYAKEIRLFDLGSLFISRSRDVRAQLRHERLEIATGRSIGELVTSSCTTIAVVGSYSFIAYQTVLGQITLGDLIIYYEAFQKGQMLLQQMLNGLSALYENNLFLSTFYEFLELEPTIIEPEHPLPVPRPIEKGIVFDQVTFQYPTSQRKTLKGVSFTIRPGETIALVGENGAGKTTLIKLLCRLHNPSGGRIMIDGIDLREFNTTELRKQISVVFQDYAHYHLTARENIWCGNISIPPDDEEQLESAAQYSGADEVIASLPNGYNTMLSNWFKDGEELSIGQWQKIALARAFLRDAQIIILDEPTSAMDAQAENQVFEKFRQLAKDKSAIIISHRLSSVRMADCIYVLSDGRIVESGTHDELMSLSGTYARLFDTQAQYYK